MQLHRVPLHRSTEPPSVPVEPGSGEELGTASPLPGVEEAGSRGAWAPAGLSWRSRLLLAWLLYAVLGQGERLDLDRRFRSVDATLGTYWEALRANDPAGAWECLAEGRGGAPYPGMVWFLPPSDEIRLADLHPLPVERGRALVSYEVRYRPTGGTQEFSFHTSSELIRSHGEWRIVRPMDAATVPEWRPQSGPIAG